MIKLKSLKSIVRFSKFSHSQKSLFQVCFLILVWLIAVSSRLFLNGNVYGLDFSVFQPDGVLYAIRTYMFLQRDELISAVTIENWDGDVSTNSVQGGFWEDRKETGDVLKGLKEEIEKIDKLTDYEYLKKEILIPSINFSLERQIITEIESKILKETIEKQVVQNLDLEKFFKGKAKSEISRQIKKLIDKKMLIPERDSARKYVLRFDNNYLLRGIIKMLDEKGFLPIRD